MTYIFGQSASREVPNLKQPQQAARTGWLINILRWCIRLTGGAVLRENPQRYIRIPLIKMSGFTHKDAISDGTGSEAEELIAKVFLKWVVKDGTPLVSLERVNDSFAPSSAYEEEGDRKEAILALSALQQLNSASDLRLRQIKLLWRPDCPVLYQSELVVAWMKSATMHKPRCVRSWCVSTHHVEPNRVSKLIQSNIWVSRLEDYRSLTHYRIMRKIGEGTEQEWRPG